MSYRKLDIGDRAVRRADLGPLPKLEWLPLSELVIDDDFQRPLGRGNWSAIDKIAASFSWSHFTPVIVSRIASGKYSVIDGQHRCHAAKIVGVHDVPVMMVDLTEAQQAAAFGAINGQVTAISPAQLFRAALAARETWAIACDQIVRDADCTLMQYAASAETKKAGQLFTINLVRKHVAADRGALVTAALKALWSAPSADEPRLWSMSIMNPWMSVLQTQPRALRRDLGAFIAGHDPLKTERGVDVMRTKPEYRGISRTVLMQSLLAAQLTKWMLGEGT
jgi:hypothetical protein